MKDADTTAPVERAVDSGGLPSTEGFAPPSAASALDQVRQGDTEDAVRRLPFTVRRRHRETVASYVRRHRAANFEVDRKPSTFVPTRTWLTQACLKAGLRIEDFQIPTPRELRHEDGTTCEACRYGSEGRWMCRVCAHGESIAQQPHMDQIICARHRRWVGPGTMPEQQTRVTDDYIQAELQYQRLRRRGLATASLLRELVHVVDPDSFDPVAPKTLPWKPFPQALRLWTLLTARAVIHRLLDPSRTFADSYADLGHLLREELGADELMVRRAWLLLRPLSLAVRRAHLSGEPATAISVHDLRVGDLSTYHWSRQLPHAPEPFQTYLTTCSATLDLSNWRGVAVPNFPGLPNATLKKALRQGTKKICAHGHPTDGSLSGSATRTMYPCRVCYGRVASAGENDFASKWPELTPWWDTDANAPLTPSKITAHSTQLAAWRCPDLGHRFQKRVQLFVKTPECPYCTHRALLIGFNSIAEHAPHLLGEWSTRNPLAAHQVLAQSPEFYWWECHKAGHEDYLDSPRHRITHGTGCTACEPNPRGPRKRKSPTMTTTWLDLHPRIMSEWHPTRNGVAGERAINTDMPRWWKCQAAGHEVKSTLSNRRATRGCTSCRKEHRIGFGMSFTEL